MYYRPSHPALASSFDRAIDRLVVSERFKVAVPVPQGDKEKGFAAHVAWERTRGDENECDAEARIKQDAVDRGVFLSTSWWHGWLERSDAWRDQIGHHG